MYTREEASRQRQAFWTAFGQYMQPVLNADNERVSWVNYKTGIAGIHFRMNADHNHATIAIVLSQADPSVRISYYRQFEQIKNMLHDTLGESWQWHSAIADESGKTISTIVRRIDGVNIHKNEDWPQLISFFKARIIALDAFWCMARYSFEQL
jgi:hypothetical protein